MTRILIVDDERQIRRALSLHLGARGYEIFEADTDRGGILELDVPRGKAVGVRIKELGSGEPRP